jgi:RHS repeat-associated protein
VHFNDRADVDQYAYPSAVASFDDTQNNLGIVYNANSGLIRTYSYYGSTAPGYTQSESVQKGASGTPLVLKQYQYTQVSAGSVTIYPTIAVTAYRDDAGVQPVTTNFAYTFFPGTTAVQQRTTIWPIVPASQNGSGVAESRVEQFDQWGNPASSTDERGVVTQFVTDVVTGGLLQRTDDATGMALVTDFTLDNLGRTIQSLGPSHTIDVGGVATVVRTASWTVYDDGNMQVRTAQGYATGTSPNYTYTLVNPVAITIMDGDGNVTDQISATRASTAGPLLPSDTFAQSSYVRWTHNVFNDNDQQTATQVYFLIPASGSGLKGINYNEADFGFDSIARQNRVVNGGGTVTRAVHDARGLPLSVWVGTNDTGATDTDPTGGGAAGNNMVAVQINVYDGGAGGGDGKQTQQIMPVDGNPANNRVTNMQYDWRNRQVQITLPQDTYQVNTFDTMDRIVQVDRHAQATGTLIGRSATNYDNRGRAYQTIRFGVDPSTGAVGNALTDNTWYDPVGNVMMQLPAGSQGFTKSVYDALNRQTVQYVGYYSATPTYAQAADISGATIVEQVETAWDEASSGIQTTIRQRFHNATGLGPLTQPGGPQPQARVTYTAMYPDGVGRNQALAEYGTNGDAPFTRPAAIPVSSDTVLVTRTLYNDRGEPYQTVDPAGTADQTTLDDAGRRIELIRNYKAGQPSTGDINVTVQWTYTADNQTASTKALNSATGDQTTTWNYGTTLGSSDVARNDVVSGMVYPDGGVVSYLVNRQSERKQFTDQNGTVHVFDRDMLGREINDRVVTLATGIDGTVQRIGRTFEVRGMLQNVTSYSSPMVGQGVVVNDVQRVYNSFEQPVTEYQEHDGAVNPAKSVSVGYQYADGSANTVRQTGLLYPDGRLVTMSYGAGGIDDALSRVVSLIDSDGTHLVDYVRIGADTFVQAASPQPQIAWSLINGTGADPYTGLDQFNRVVDNRWYNTATNADLDRIQHGYDRASNRLYRKNTVADAAGVFLDELYGYDGMYRLARLDRGQLNSTNTGIVSGTEDFTQAWGLDSTGNWSSFDEADTGGSWTLQQTRTANAVNEITGITGGGWVVPAYDGAGNTTVFPQPNAPTTANQGVYDAWNRLMAILSGGSTIQQNAYDGLHRRVTKAASGTIRHAYFSAGWQNLEERLGGATSADQQFIWGFRYINDLVLRGTGDAYLYALHDPNWNVTAICDGNGAVAERYNYSAFGQPMFRDPAFIVISASAFAFDVLFSAAHWDSEVSLLYARRRYVNVLIGAWLTRDPILVGGANLYLFADGDPVSLLDPQGTQAGSADSGANDADQCKCCEDKVGALPPEKKKATYKGKKGTCTANIECKPTCPNDLFGSTMPPQQTAPGQYTIDICISCKVTDATIGLVIDHELIHFKRFCAAGKGITNCIECKIQEGKAYEESCKEAFPNDAAKRNRCEKCGIFFGCGSMKSDSGKGPCVVDQDPKCEPGDIGAALK